MSNSNAPCTKARLPDTEERERNRFRNRRTVAIRISLKPEVFARGQIRNGIQDNRH